jgi:hypothetical protein
VYGFTYTVANVINTCSEAYKTEPGLALLVGTTVGSCGVANGSVVSVSRTVSVACGECTEWRWASIAQPRLMVPSI